MRVEFRAKEMMASILLFSLLVLVVFSFAFNPVDNDLSKVFAGILWIAFFFAGTLGLNRSFVAEKGNDALSGLVLAPIDRSSLFLGKFISNLLFMTVVEVLMTPIFFVLLRYPYQGGFGPFVAVLVLGTIGFAAIGTFLAALASNARASEVLLPILLFPLLAPEVIFTVRATEGALGGDMDQLLTGLRFLGAYDLIFLAVPFLLFDYLVES